MGYLESGTIIGSGTVINFGIFLDFGTIILAVLLFDTSEYLFLLDLIHRRSSVIGHQSRVTDDR